MKKITLILPGIFSCLYSFAQTPQLVPGNYQTSTYAQSALPGALGDCIGLNGNLIFAANNALWQTDGTLGGTNLVLTIGNDTAQRPNGLTLYNGKIYFTADDGVHGRELWVTDGTSAGTYMIKDINPGIQSSLYINSVEPFLYNFQVFDGKLYFAANNGSHGRELWYSDGTAANTSLFMDVCIGTCDGLLNHKDIFSLPGKLFFSAYDGLTGISVFKSDGTPGGTITLLDSLVTNFTNFQPCVDKVIFTINNAGGVYVSDGTISGTTLIVPTAVHVSNVAILNNKGYFFAATNIGNNGYSLWATDGTASGTDTVCTSLLSGVPNTLFFKKNRFQIKNINNLLIFSAGTVYNDIELWHSDGTKAGTSILKDIKIQNGSLPDDFTEFNNKLYFRADTSRHELWFTDGTATGTQMVAMPGANSTESAFEIMRYMSCNMVSTGHALYYYAHYDSALGNTPRIYKLDLFPAEVGNTIQISAIDIYPNPTQGLITIDAENAQSIIINSIDGKQIYRSDKFNSDKITVDARSFAAGSYTISTLLFDGTKRYGKFVKQ